MVPVDRIAVEEAVILVLTLPDGHKAAIRAQTIMAVAGVTPQVNEKGETVGPAIVYTSTSRWNVKETVDEVLSAWCPVARDG